MESIDVTTVLDRGARYLGNSPEHLSKRMALAHLLVDARIVRTAEAAVLAFRLWAVPESRQHPVEKIIAIATDKARATL